MGWDSTSYLTMYACNSTGCSTAGKRNFTKNISWAITDLEWGYDCGNYTVTYQQLNTTSIYLGSTGALVKSYVFPVQVYSANQFDVNNLILAVFLANNTAFFIDTNKLGTSVFLTLNFSSLANFNRFSDNTSTFIVATSG